MPWKIWLLYNNYDYSLCILITTMNHYSCLTIIWYSYKNRKQSFSVFILHHFSSFFLSLHAAKLRINKMRVSLICWAHRAYMYDGRPERKNNKMQVNYNKMTIIMKERKRSRPSEAGEAEYEFHWLVENQVCWMAVQNNVIIYEWMTGLRMWKSHLMYEWVDASHQHQGLSLDISHDF